MFRKVWFFASILTCIVLSTACNPGATSTPTVELANPAAVYCEEQGNVHEIVTNEDGSQGGVCILPDGTVCDEWEYLQGECEAQEQESATVLPVDLPIPLPIDPAEYEGWWTYTHPGYNFSIMLPEDWIVEEITTDDPLMNGHMLMLYPEYNQEAESIRLTFRRTGEDVLLFPTGVGEGTFLEQGTLEIAGKPARRMLLVCTTGEVDSIWYHGEDEPYLVRGDLEFGFVFTASPLHCDSGVSLEGKTQHVGEMIIASLSMP